MNKHDKKTDQAFVQANGIQIAYDILGDPDASSLLLISGLGSQMINWHEDFCAEFTARGYRVIRFDNRDVGLSTTFDDAGIPDISHLTRAHNQGETLHTPYTLRDMADDAAGLLDALKIDSAHILGSSMGGRIAQIMAIHYPNRVRTLTSVMATMGEPGYQPPKPEAYELLSRPVPTGRRSYIESSVFMHRILSGTGFPIDEAFIRERAEAAFDRGLNPGGTTRQLAALMAEGSSKDELGKLKAPTLVIHGSDDPLIPVECARDIADTIPGAQLLIIQGMGHSLMDIPQAWPQVIDAVTLHAT